MKNFKFFPVLFLALLLAACSDIDGLNDYNAVFSFEITEHKGTDGEIVIGEPVMAGNTIRMVPVSEVLFLQAADKYVRVVTASGEHLLRTPLKDLLPQLDADAFWQIHRATVVRADAIDTVQRDEAGKLQLHLRGCAEPLAVSRLYAHRFKAM